MTGLVFNKSIVYSSNVVVELDQIQNFSNQDESDHTELLQLKDFDQNRPSLYGKKRLASSKFGHPFQSSYIYLSS